MHDSRTARPVLWQRPAWARPVPLAAAWAALLVYGSLIPFQFIGDRYHGIAELLSSPRWTAPRGGASSLGISASTSDLVTNLVLYLPLGVLLRLAMAQETRWRSVQIVTAVAVAAGLSWCMESMQALAPHRVPSIQDAIANGAAAAVGAVFGVALKEGCWTLLFAAHRITAQRLLPAWERLRRSRTTTAVRVGALAAAGCVAIWIILDGPTAKRAWAPPFVAEFERPYDVAGVILTQALLAYGLMAAMLAVWLVRSSAAASLARLAAATFVATAAIAGARWVIWGTPTSLTEPALALLAAMGVLGAAFTVVHGVRRRCRRRQSRPVSQDRRCRSHDYAFAITR